MRRSLGYLLLADGVLLCAGFGGDINGVRYSIGFGMFRLSATAVMMFYIPIYGAILYHYIEDGGISSIVKIIDLADDSVLITFYMPNLNVAIIMM